MKKVIKYTTENESQKLITQMIIMGWRLYEVQNLLTGNYLIFDDGIADPADRDLASEFDKLKQTLIDKGIL